MCEVSGPYNTRIHSRISIEKATLWKSVADTISFTPRVCRHDNYSHQCTVCGVARAEPRRARRPRAQEIAAHLAAARDCSEGSRNKNGSRRLKRFSGRWGSALSGPGPCLECDWSVWNFLKVFGMFRMFLKSIRSVFSFLSCQSWFGVLIFEHNNNYIIISNNSLAEAPNHFTW